MPSRILARYNTRLAALERRAAPPPPAFTFTPQPSVKSSAVASIAAVVQPSCEPVKHTTAATTAPPQISTPALATNAAAAGAISVSNLEGEMLDLSYPDQVSPVLLHLENLRSCTVLIRTSVSALSASNLHNCTLWLSHAHTSVFFDQVSSCTLSLCARQVRFRRARHCTLLARTQSAPLIEDSTDVGVAPYASWQPAQPVVCAACENGAASEWREWREVQDMSWARTHESSPNWRLVASPERCDPLPHESAK